MEKSQIKEMGKLSSKPIMEMAEQVLAKPMRANKSSKKPSLRQRWVEATWVGIGKKANEHTVVLDDDGPAIRVRTVTRRPMPVRWNIEKVKKVRARPRYPNPKDEDQEEALPDRLTIGIEITEHGDELEPIGRRVKEVTGRNFRITEPLLEKYGRAEGCAGCEASLLGDYRKISGSARRHTEACRAIIEAQMVGTEDNIKIRRRARQAEETGQKEKEEEKAVEED